MIKKIIILFIFMLSLLPQTVFSAGGTQYSRLVHKVDNMPSAKIIELADKYEKQNRHGDALVLYAVVYGRFKDSMNDDEKNQCAMARLKAGKIYYDKADYSKALDEFICGVKVSEQCDKPKFAARIYNNIGNVYCLFFEWEKGIGYYHKAYKLSKYSCDSKVEHDILLNMAGMYTFLGDLPNAIKYYKMSEQTKDPGDPEDVYMSGYAKSLIQIYKGNVAEGVARLKSLAVYAVQKKLEPKYQCFAYQEICYAYVQQGRSDSALKYMNLCDTTSRRYNLQHNFASVLKSLSEFYEDNGDVVKSNYYKSRYLSIMDSIYNTRKFDAAKNSLFTYEVDKTMREISDLHTREEQRLQTIRLQRVVTYAALIVAIVTMTFLFVVWRQKRRLHQSYADLYSVNRNFIDTQEELISRLRQADKTIKAKDEELEIMKAERADVAIMGEVAQDEQAKCQKKGLTGDQAQILADAIRNVMENTTAYCNVNFSLAMLAEMVESNSKYVSQVINDTFHKSFYDYVNPYRIHLACARFKDTEHYGHLTMKAVAESVGFRSYSSFVSVFRKITGITPSLYQNMALKDKV